MIFPKRISMLARFIERFGDLTLSLKGYRNEMFILDLDKAKL